MPSERLRAASHLFTVRLWSENLGDDQVEWRGQVTHVLSGESHYFRQWDELDRHLQAMAGWDDPLAPESRQAGSATSVEKR